MRILRYLTREVLTHMLAVSFVLLVIIISGRFVKYLAEAAVGDLAANVLLPVMFYRLPGFLELIIPLGLFIGILMSYGRLYVESEMVVLSACGVSPSRLARYTLVPAVIVSVLVGVLSLWVTPMGASRSEALLDDPESSQGLHAMAAGRFQSRRASDTVSYAQRIDQDGTMYSVFLSQRERDSSGNLRMVVTVAEEAEMILDGVSGARYLELRNGYRYSGYPGNMDYDIAQFDTFGEMIPEPEGGIRTADPVDGRATSRLWASDSLEDRAALQWRLSIPLMVPIVAVIAMCLSRTDHRRGRYAKMAPAFLIYLAYLMLLANARTAFAEGGGVPGGLWWVHCLFALVALAMLYGDSLRTRFTYWRRNRASA
ncbi:LPS export ABC transporter permease LptF [Halioglobus japonicus]|uniref:Lipopolysaccharide export system permease protein LptF n=1 Tax=Halioglobus japonicus TaxID=930805 RepID=A0AAP8MEZ1_9GAMM|nr:LPS export ABC transporter permease LptF [Halioglobus japonicus]AQA18424.1 LPS export ABC transporter permease LptF [Halioglobus japonicus]PLW86439.1 LPS export ABC transporter permease LptF [Halioglobus japonicus]GHD12837.1 LPS export ABC transporter permease LptF [Halioglobus japonicus]